MYAKIAKIRKQKLDKIESELLKIKQDIRGLKSDLERVLSDIKNLKVPKSGSMELFVSFNERKRILGNQKDSLLREIHMKELQLSKAYQRYKKANIEYEKVKYLEEVELKKRLEGLKREEQKILDEVSGILFNAKGV